jgi:phospholipid transport system substrate-binding protein
VLTRRTTIIFAAAAAFSVTLPWGGWPARAQSDPQAETFVNSTSEALVAIVNSEDTAREKHRRLRDVVNSAVDDEDIGRFCLGRFWRLATPEQQKQYMVLFHDLLVTRIAAHLGEYRGVRVTMGSGRTSASTEIVTTTVERPGTPAYQVEWVVSPTTDGPKIVDLLADGTSLRLTQSSDFASYLARHQYSIHELIEGMRQLVANSQ